MKKDWNVERAFTFLLLMLLAAMPVAFLLLFWFWLLSTGWIVVGCLIVLFGVIAVAVKFRPTALILKWLGYALIFLTAAGWVAGLFTPPRPDCVETRYFTC